MRPTKERFSCNDSHTQPYLKSSSCSFGWLNHLLEGDLEWALRLDESGTTRKSRIPNLCLTILREPRLQILPPHEEILSMLPLVTGYSIQSVEARREELLGISLYFPTSQSLESIEKA
jgi:hypothetical protein